MRWNVITRSLRIIEITPMSYDYVVNEYFEWLYNLVCGKRYSQGISFRKLLMHLHRTEFIYVIPMDENRACDGVDLRYRFAYDYTSPATVESYLDGPCSVLEMMVALAVRCEEQIMDDPKMGDRTAQWFWNMIVNLGLGSMVDEYYDEKLVTDILDLFLHREYAPDGRGGLFTVRGIRQDMRDIEIFGQLCAYIDTLI